MEAASAALAASTAATAASSIAVASPSPLGMQKLMNHDQACVTPASARTVHAMDPEDYVSRSWTERPSVAPPPSAAGSVAAWGAAVKGPAPSPSAAGLSAAWRAAAEGDESMKRLMRPRRWSPEEDDAMLKAHVLQGNRWSAIADSLPGRSRSHLEVKVRFRFSVEGVQRKCGHFIEPTLVLISTLSLATNLPEPLVLDDPHQALLLHSPRPVHSVLLRRPLQQGA